jgi:hypothetical protein
LATSGIVQSDRGSVPSKGKRFYFFSVMSSLALWPIQSPV